ncbi:MAG: hypothetical protein Q9213_006061 [Squamulea squamosa]
MPPPPIPIDPAIDTWRPSNTVISPTLGLDHLLQSSPIPPDRLQPCNPSDLTTLAHEVHLPAMKQAPTDPNPLLRFWNDPGPWTSQRISADPGLSPMNPQYAQFDYRTPRNASALQYDHHSPRSDIGSSTTGRYPFDSGYGGSRSLATKSVRSADHVDQSPSCQSVAGDVHDLNLYHSDNIQDPSAASATSPHPQFASMDSSNDAPPSPTLTFDLTCHYQSCGVISKNQSEHRKHMLRHHKPYKCDVAGCSKVDGFSTNNDLDRHKKSVHKIMPKNSTDRSFRCAAINCPKREKIWPRLDNFRQHCLRIHPEEECDELVRKSELDPGSAVEAIEMANSSNHNAGDTEPGAGIGELTDYLNPSITFDHPMNMMPFQCGVDTRMQQAQHFRSHSPILPGISSNVARYVPYLQPPVASQLLQAPEPNTPHRRSQSPSRTAFEEPHNVVEPASLGTLSKKIPKSKPLASIKKAEQISEELASEIAKCIDPSKGQPGDIQAAIKNKVLLVLNPSLSRKRSAQVASLKEDLLHPKRKKITCNQCSVTTARQCDMKKHQKRHTRPYGCTFPGCSKKLGSKNDWKRHENTQHYQIETWRCHEYSKSSAIGQCANVFYRREQFQGHLRDKHEIHDDKYIQEQCKRHRIGRNGQGKFWCGFCQKIVELKTKGLEAWEERFGHIDNLHYKNGQTIYDWVPLDGHVSKGLMGKGDYMHCGAKSDDNEDPDEHEEESSDDDGDDQTSQKSVSKGPWPRPGPEGVPKRATAVRAATTYRRVISARNATTGDVMDASRRQSNVVLHHLSCVSKHALYPVYLAKAATSSNKHFYVDFVTDRMSGYPEGKDGTSSPSDNVSTAAQHPNSAVIEKLQISGEDNDANGYRETDIRKKQVFKGRYLFWLAYQSVGVIYGDIGTSPLYVYSSTFTSDPSYHDLLGALSLIIWTVTLMVTVKYVMIVLRADDEGEGGTFAIYSLLSRYVRFSNISVRQTRSKGLVTQANIVQRDPREERSIQMKRADASSLSKTSKQTRSFLEQSTAMKILLKVVGVLGVSLVMSDGVLTPAQSVLGAIQGLRIVDDGIETATIVGVTCSILILLFLIQPFGESGSRRSNLIQHDHTVLKAFSPVFAGQYLMRRRTEGWKSLGGILLAFTGVEALFADLGAFTRRAIQISWLCFAYPCLLLAYIGQAAFISDHSEAYSNPFFNAVPPGMFYPSLVVAVLASIVASQTMVTATFQTTKLGQAYGVCVILVTFITTCMVSLVALIVWHVPLAFVVSGFLVFGALDGVYLSSALTKVPDGAWFTLVLAVLLSSIFVLWRFGKENQWRAEASDLLAPSDIIDWGHADRIVGRDVVLRFTHTFGSAPISAIKGMGIFFDKSGLPNTSPTVFIHFLQKFQAAPAVVVFFHIRPLAIPSVPLEERFTVTRCLGRLASNVRNQFFRVTLRHGYTDEVVHEDLGVQIYEQLRDFVIREGAITRGPCFLKREIADHGPPLPAESMLKSSTISSIPESTSEGHVTIDQISDASAPSNQGQSASGHPDSKEQQERVRQGLASLKAAYHDRVVYVVGKEQMRIQEYTGCTPRSWCRRIALAAFLWLRSNTGSKIANLNVDVDKLVEIGFVKVV